MYKVSSDSEVDGLKLPSNGLWIGLPLWQSHIWDTCGWGEGEFNSNPNYIVHSLTCVVCLLWFSAARRIDLDLR